MKDAIEIVRRFGTAMSAQAEARHAAGDIAGWMELNAQALAATRIEVRLKRAMKPKGKPMPIAYIFDNTPAH